MFLLFSGIFALAIFDHNSEELILARDRLGVKPLYYQSTSMAFDLVQLSKAYLLANVSILTRYLILHLRVMHYSDL